MYSHVKNSLHFQCMRYDHKIFKLTTVCHYCN